MTREIKKNREVLKLNNYLNTMRCSYSMNKNIRTYSTSSFVKCVYVYDDEETIIVGNSFVCGDLEEEVFFDTIKKFTACEDYSIYYSKERALHRNKQIKLKEFLNSLDCCGNNINTSHYYTKDEVDYISVTENSERIFVNRVIPKFNLTDSDLLKIVKSFTNYNEYSIGWMG